MRMTRPGYQEIFNEAHTQGKRYITLDTGKLPGFDVDVALNWAWDNGWKLHSAAGHQTRTLYVFERRADPYEAGRTAGKSFLDTLKERQVRERPVG